MTTSVWEGMVKLISVMICFLPFYSAGRILWLRRRTPAEAGETTSVGREAVLGLFVLFMLGLLSLTFEHPEFTREGENIWLQGMNRLKTGLGVNFVPFRTIRRYLKYSSDSGNIFVNLAGNIVMFLPWALGLLLLWKKNQSFLKLTLMSAGLPVCIEFIQLFIGRSVDIDDVILNFAGGMLGGLVYLILVTLWPRLRKLAR